ncbi:helix-turn-helix domain-containing protein [Fulvimarina sp. MAC8]|uniref:winged helix-turn-helix transcriptional regulator n=1 Tax=Fulvimarina sp. MAC8 TaxID=3162874 RepID=UPI0032EB5B8D
MTQIPVPGKAVRGSRSGSPIMAMFDLLGRRWAMGVLWTLSERGASTFRGLQEACETISPAVLNSRLKELQAAGFVEQTPNGYAVTELGMSVYEALIPLSGVSKQWAASIETVTK